MAALIVTSGQTIEVGGTVSGVTGTFVYQDFAVVSAFPGVLSETDMTVLSGAVANVDSGGSVANATIVDGALEFVYGVASGGTVGAFGQVIVKSNGVASGVTVASNGTEYLSYGGSAVDALVETGGYQTVTAGATATGSILETSGFEYVYGQATATGTEIDNGGQVVFGGGLVVGAVISGPVGYQSVLSGGTVSDTVVELGGDEIIYAGAIVNPVTLEAGAIVGLVGVKANGAYVDGSGNLKATSDGVVVDAVLLSSASSDAFGFSVVPAGNILGAAGGSFIVALSDTAGGGFTISGLGESVDVRSGQVDSGANLSGYAVEQVEGGGQTLAAHVDSQGIQIISSGGLTSGSVVVSGAYEVVYSGAQDSNLTLEPGAFFYAYGVSGASAYVDASNQLVVTSGGSVVETVGLNAATYGVHYSTTNDGFDDTILNITRSVVDDFNGDGRADILIENTSGAVVVGEIVRGQEVYTQVAALGPEWAFVGTGDFFNDGKQGFVIENTSGAVVYGEVSGGAVTYTQLGALGPEWSFVGATHPNSDSDNVLIRNSNGAVADAQVQSGTTQFAYAVATGLGPEWSFAGAGDLLGDGHNGALIENTNGAVVVAEGTGSGVVFSQVGALGPEWKFVAAGAFLGGGQTDFLIENTNGAVVLGQVVSGHAQYTQLGGLGPEWSFVGAGDYYGTGTDSFMIENTSGALVTGTIVGGHVQYAQVSALGSEWKFHG